MTFDYSGLAATSVSQIADKGRDVTLTYKSTNIYDPQTDTNAEDSSTTQTVRMLITNYNKREIDGTLIKNSDRQGLLANDSLTRAPAQGDTVTDGTEVLTVKNIEEIKPGDTVLLYKLQLRK